MNRKRKTHVLKSKKEIIFFYCCFRCEENCFLEFLAYNQCNDLYPQQYYKRLRKTIGTLFMKLTLEATLQVQEKKEKKKEQNGLKIKLVGREPDFQYVKADYFFSFGIREMKKWRSLTFKRILNRKNINLYLGKVFLCFVNALLSRITFSRENNIK